MKFDSSGCAMRGLYYILIIIGSISDIVAVNVCKENPRCQCSDSFGEIKVLCILIDSHKFDFATVDLDNIAHITIRGNDIRLARTNHTKDYSILKSLVLEGNTYKTHLTKPFLDQFPNLESLQLNDCGLTGIEMEAFGGLSSIRSIDLSRNGNIGFQAVTNAFKGFRSRNLRHLNLSLIHISESLSEGLVPYSLFKSLQNTSLENLDISWNRIYIVAASLDDTPHIKYFNASGTALIGRFDCLTTVIGADSIVELVLDYWPTTTRGYDLPINAHPRYKHKRAGECVGLSTTSSKGCYYLPRNLKTLQIQHSRIASFYIDFTKDLCFEPNQIVNFLMAYITIERPMSEMHGLTYTEVFDISYPEFESELTFPGTSNKTFIDMPSLKKLLIPGNRLYLFSQDELRNLFTNCWQLHLIDMSSNNLTTLPVDIFRNNTLMIHINMSRNELGTFTVSLSQLRYLETLDLSFNTLKILDQTFITNRILNDNSMFLSLDYNQFECDCTINELLALNVSELNMTCREGEETRFIKSSNFTERLSFQCIDTETGVNVVHIIVGCMCGFLLIVIILSVFIWCKCRRNPLENNINSKSTQEPFVHVIPMEESHGIKRNPKFLAFIAYSHDDRDFVCDVLYPNLDATLRQLMPRHDSNSLLTLYDKHFLPGEEIDLICEQAIIQSYVTVAIISQSFLESFWCSYEMKTAVHANIPVIPLYLDSVDPSKLKGIFKHMYDNKVRMEWPVNARDNISQLEIKTLIMRLGQAICANITAFKEREKDDMCNKKDLADGHPLE